ncbi:MAG: extracellular solute-binding protein [Lachnospiraceae bacterium]|nr:extracellular solute-binding protein [Lachnospiraceae bacterium]
MKVIMMIVSLIMSVCFGDVGGISFPGLDGMFGKKEVVKVQITPMPKPTEEPGITEAPRVTQPPKPTTIPKPTATPKINTEGAELNIFCYNAGLKNVMENYYEEYIRIDDTTGRIGEVEVNWIIPAIGEDYYGPLLEKLRTEKVAAPEDRIDLFMIEPEYGQKFIEEGVTMSVRDLGISPARYSDMYEYTLWTMADRQGDPHGLTWECCPGVLFYNCEIAEEAFGTSDPVVIQSYVRDWDAFMKTAEILAGKGYRMITSIYDSYRVYAENRNFCWEKGGYLCRDDNVERWASDAKNLLELGAAGTYEPWVDAEWYEDWIPDSKVFCYFGTEWFMDTCDAHLTTFEDCSVKDVWGAVKGPQSFSWGGGYLCAANGTDNPELAKTVLADITTSEKLLRKIATEENTFVNNENVMAEAEKAGAKEDAVKNAADYTVQNRNMITLYRESAEAIDGSHKSAYDIECNELFQETMKLYFDGTVATVEEAVKIFRQTMKDTYPELIVEH